MSKASIIRFLAALLLASWAVQGLMLYFAGSPDSAAAAPWLVGIMFFPTVAAILYRVGFNKTAFRHVTLRLGNPAYLLLAALIPAATALIVLGVVLLAGWGQSDYFTFGRAGVTILDGPWLLGLGAQSWPAFAANIALTAAAYAAVNCVATVGEEFGWRGFLQQPMIEQFGLTGGVALLGVVWGAWHLPTILAGYNYPDTPVLGGLVLFPVLLTAASFVMAWLTIRAGSFWPAVVMHGSVNGVHQGIVQHITLTPGITRLYVDLTEIVVTLIVGAVCLWALTASGRRPGHQTNPVSEPGAFDS